MSSNRNITTTTTTKMKLIKIKDTAIYVRIHENEMNEMKMLN